MSSATDIEVNPDAGTGFPDSVSALSGALIRQREYTLALYADLPTAYWEPAKVPYLPIVNPPLWELAHIAWFAEFFCLRWRRDDVVGANTPSILASADKLFDSQAVTHRFRWSNVYPDRAVCFRYMQHSLEAVLSALESGDPADLYGSQLALAHEDMHAEALAMTLFTLGLPVPDCLPARCPGKVECLDLHLEGGTLDLGASDRGFRFDNEMPPFRREVMPFSIASRPVSAAEFAQFIDSPDYGNDLLWSGEGRVWRVQDHNRESGALPDFAAIHVGYFEAEAWCRWAGRRLPTEAEWEFAATHAPEFQASTGQIWEWCASAFQPFPGFSPGRYREYSEPWFHTHQVLKGGSFATKPRLKYAQFRNFYTRERRDMFCGFRTCAIA